MPRFDVVVVGAGPAGATCARGLARAGLRVAILDRAAPPRYKTCGGGLVWRARRLLEIDLAPAIELELSSAEMHLAGAGPDSAESFRVTRPQPIVTMTMRARLDQHLTSAAVAAGALLEAPRTLTGLEPDGSELRVSTDRGPLRAAFVVAADGAAGATARAAGWTDERRLLPAIESEIEVPPEVHARFAAGARFDFGHLSQGYAWVFPKSDHLSVGCLAAGSERHRLRREFESYLRALGLERPLAREDHGFVIPVRPRRRLVRGRVLLVGDAAGLADPVTCEGISWAVDSARRAARALIAHLGDPAAARRAYRRDLERHLLPELARARTLAWLLYRRPRLRRFAFRRFGRRLCEAVAGVMMGERRYRQIGFGGRSR